MSNYQNNDMPKQSMSLFCTRLRAFHLACTTISGSISFSLGLLLNETMISILTEHFELVGHLYELIEISLILGISFSASNFMAFVALSLGVPFMKESNTRNV